MPISKPQLIILGIDPGLANTGFGIIRKQGNNLKVVDYGVIRTKSKAAAANRLNDIYQAVSKIIKKHQPDIIAIEQLFFCKNVKTASAVGQARGVIILAAGQNQLRIEEFTPLQVKMALTTYGRATKNQVQAMVKAILALEKIPKPDDAADALAVAICCGNSLKNYGQQN